MRFNAIFTGANGSMGFIHGEEYVLQVLQDKVYRKNAYPIYDMQPRIVGCEPPAHVPVPYGSWQAFWQNWKKPE